MGMVVTVVMGIRAGTRHRREVLQVEVEVAVLVQEATQAWEVVGAVATVIVIIAVVVALVAAVLVIVAVADVAVVAAIVVAVIIVVVISLTITQPVIIV